MDLFGLSGGIGINLEIPTGKFSVIIDILNYLGAYLSSVQGLITNPIRGVPEYSKFHRSESFSI